MDWLFVKKTEMQVENEEKKWSKLLKDSIVDVNNYLWTIYYRVYYGYFYNCI